MERHRTDFISLLFGLLFAGLGAAALLDGRVLARLWGPEVWPILLIVLGGWVLLATLGRSGWRPGTRAAPAPVTSGAPERPGGADPSRRDDPAPHKKTEGDPAGHDETAPYEEEDPAHHDDTAFYQRTGSDPAHNEEEGPAHHDDTAPPEQPPPQR